MTQTIRWGVLGPGNIARKFADGLRSLDDNEIVAVGSRSLDRARQFAELYNVPDAHGSYDALASDPDVDAVYVATPHPGHRKNVEMCMNAGKAVLCEKPFAVNAVEAKSMVDCARRNGVFCMEAMWTRFLPSIVKVREWLAEGRIGEPRMVTADFGFRSGWNPEGRLLNPDLAGGALLDVGVYTIAFAFMVLGFRPKSVLGASHIGETGVDEQTGIVIEYENGALACLSCAVRTATPQTGRIDGTDGRIVVPAFWRAQNAMLESGAGAPDCVEHAHDRDGFNFEVMEVARCLREGKTESDVLPLDETVAIAETMDEIRRQIGLVYPMEKP